MAKRTKKRTYRRRRIGAVAGGAVPMYAGIAVGAIGARLLAAKLLVKMDPKINAAIQLAAGAFLSMQKQPIIKGVGLGMFGAGVVAGGQSLNLIAGVDRSSYQQPYPTGELANIAGDHLNYLGNPQGSPDMAVISGLGNPEGSPQFAVINGDNCLY